MYILLFGDGNMLFFEDLALFTFKVHLCLHALVVFMNKCFYKIRKQEKYSD